MLGPLGRPFEVDPRSRHLLLIAGGLGIAGVRMLADDALRAGREVTLLFGAASATEVYPSSLLPDEVEYIVATDDGSLGHPGYVTELVPDYEGWADQAFACGPAPMLAALARLAAGRSARLGVATLGRKPGRGGRAGSRRSPRAGLAGGPPKGVPAGLDGAEHGLRDGRLPGLRRDGRPGRAPARLPRRPGLRLGRARLGVGLVSGPGNRPKGGPIDRSAGAPARVDLSVELPRGLRLDNPILVASGTFGYGTEYGEVVDVQRLGAICCKGTTLRPRVGNITPRVTETPAGMLNSIGLQNPGVDAVIRKYGPTWRGWHVPVIVNVAGESIDDYVEVARRLDGAPGVAGIELNISLPERGQGRPPVRDRRRGRRGGDGRRPAGRPSCPSWSS